MLTKNDIEITDDFQKVLDLANNSNKNLLITGKAGTGKSTLLGLIRKNIQKNIAILAPTGLAAINVGGQTIHSFFHFSHQISSQEVLQVAKKRGKTKLFQKLECIVIDEVSMVRADILDAIDLFLQSAKSNRMPFGGIQIIMIGDLYQLPPILKKDEETEFKQKYTSPYFFSSSVIKGLLSDLLGSLEFIDLDKVFRQSDESFISILNDIRHGKNLDSSLDFLNQRVVNLNSLEFSDIPIPNPNSNSILLTTTNRKADEVNYSNLKNLDSDKQEFEAEVEGEFKNSEFPTQSTLALKIGARVMFVKNDPQGRWVNGTLGEVVEVSTKKDSSSWDKNSDNKNLETDSKTNSLKVLLDSGSEVEVDKQTWEKTKLEFNEEKGVLEQVVIGKFKQIPLRLAWAITIHKSQGQTFEKMVLDLERGAFTSGQVYVGLSRCTSLDGLTLARPVYKRDVKTDWVVDKFFEWVEKFKTS